MARRRPTESNRTRVAWATSIGCVALSWLSVLCLGAPLSSKYACFDSRVSIQSHAYDAVFAVAHALHHLLYVQGEPVIRGANENRAEQLERPPFDDPVVADLSFAQGHSCSRRSSTTSLSTASPAGDCAC